MSESYKDVVTISSPKKSREGETVLLKFHTASGEVLRLKMSADISRHLGTQLLLLSATPGDP